MARRKDNLNVLLVLNFFAKVEQSGALYGYDATPQADLVLPDAVVLPADTGQIADIVTLANKESFPIVVRGAGTNLTGGARPIAQGVVVSTQRLNRILCIDQANLQVVVQPGVVTQDLKERVAEEGLFYPVDPQSQEICTIGGNLAENAGGPRAVKYGVTRQYVLGLEVVLPNGKIVRLGARTIKSVVGYDLVSLMVGSEGTLGIITEATLRLLPQPKATSTLLVNFDSMQLAAEAVGRLIRAAIGPSALEFIDQESIRAVSAYQPMGLPVDAEAVLIVELDGSPDDVDVRSAQALELLQSMGALTVERATSDKEAQQLWKARRSVGPALSQIAAHKFNEDIVVPIANLPQAVAGVHQIGRRHQIRCACFGHAGDGNIHVNFLVDPRDEQQAKRIRQAIEETFDLVVSLQGSISGEHGIGTTKMPYLSKEIGPVVLDCMRSIKDLLDPAQILNPSKIFPSKEASDGHSH